MRRRKREIEGPTPQIINPETIKEEEEISLMPEQKLSREDLPEADQEVQKKEDLGILIQGWLGELTQLIKGELEPQDLSKSEVVETEEGKSWSEKKTMVQELVWDKIHRFMGVEELKKGDEAGFQDKALLKGNPSIVLSAKKKSAAPRLKSKGYSWRKHHGPKNRQVNKNPFWSLKTKVKKHETAVRFNLLDDVEIDVNTLFIKVTTQYGMIEDENSESFTLWHQANDIHVFQRHHLYKVEVYAGNNFKTLTQQIYTNRSHQDVDLELATWTDSFSENIQHYQYYTNIQPYENGRRWDSDFFRLTQQSFGIDYWTIQHPVRMRLNSNAPKIELPYDAFWQMTREQNQSDRGAWIPMQENLKLMMLGFIFWVLMEKLEISFLNHKLQRLFDIINEGHAFGRHDRFE